ncbi:MAG: cytochrome b/b6 domain-containing protein [Acetobacteraceae bacterium]
MSERTLPMRVWDAPTRLFHWVLVILLGVSWLSVSRGWMELHFLSGYSMVALLLFRLVWGIVGSETSRFSRFLKSPLAALRHLAHLHRREPDTEIGHNAAGGWMVLVLLALLVVQVATGLCANDDISLEGPLYKYVGKDWSDWLTHIHGANFQYLKIAVFLHVVAVLVYLAVKRHNLVGPMITGRKHLPAGTVPPALVNPLLALVVFVIVAGVVGVLVNVL